MKLIQFLIDRLFLLPIALLPQHWLSRQIHRLTRSENRWLSQRLIRTIRKSYAIDLSVAKDPVLEHYPSFNAFFTRAIHEEARPIDSTPEGLASPVDGVISQCGPISHQALFQAKGHHFNLTTLLGGEPSRARPYIDGSFSTIYLSPRDYHRIHMPIEGTLRQMIYVPGRLYPVNNPSTRTVPGLFARNERVIAEFDTAIGPMAMVLVGALFVGSIETVWAGEITPPRRGFVHLWRYAPGEIKLKKGEEMGRFNMGSTVILLFRKEKIEWASNIEAGATLEMGQQIGVQSQTD